MFNPYTKAIIGAFIALVAGLSVGIEDGVLTTSDVVVSIVGAMTALAAVWATHLLVKWLWGAAVAGATAFGTAVLDDAVSYAEWITIAAAVLGALGAIYATANTTSVKPNSKINIEKA
jgi:hypothetical protein